MILSLIVAAAENGVIGNKGQLPWSLPDDLKYFREKTKGLPIIMGRKTHESIGKPLPGRRNIVVSRQHGLQISGCDVVPSLDAALQLAKMETDEAFVIGGKEVFQAALPLASRILLTRVHANVEGDVVLPEIDWSQWQLVGTPVRHETDDRHAYPFTFEIYERKGTSH